MSNIPITSLPIANPLTGEEAVPLVQVGTTKRTTTGAISALPFGQGTSFASGISFVTVSSSFSALPSSRVLAAASPITLTDAGTSAPITISVGGILGVPNGGTGTSAIAANGVLIGDAVGSSITTVAAATTVGYLLTTTGTATPPQWQSLSGVTSVGLSGGTTGLTISNSPITSNGTMTLGGLLVVPSGGTGTSAIAANRVLVGNSVGTGISSITNATSGYALLSTGAASAPTFQALPVRELLTASRTYYVRTDGSNSNTGLVDSAGGAFLTWQKAFDVAATLDFNSQQVTVQHGVEAGVKTFTVSNSINSMTGNGSLLVKGSGTTGNTVFNVTGADCFILNNTRCTVNFDQMTLLGGASGLVNVVSDSTITLGSSARFGTAAALAHIYIHDFKAGGLILGANYQIIGNSAGYHIFINGGFVFHESCAITITGTPNFPGAFIAAIANGGVQCTNFSATGSATGSRFAVATNSVINTFGQGLNIFPGNIAGGTASGGIYIP